MTMGLPISYKVFFFPKFIHNTLSFLGLIHELIYTMLFYYPGLQDSLDPDVTRLTRYQTRNKQLSAVLTRELLPVVQYSELVNPPESCTVCLYEFAGGEEIRRLTNCRHVFHRKCVDRWMDHDRKTCPLCRTPFISEDLQEAFNEKLWTASGISDYY